MSTQPYQVPAAQRTPFEQLLQRIFGEDQAKGIEHLGETSDFLQALDKRGVQRTPYCVIVPEWAETLRSNIRGFDDAVKVALIKLLNLLVATQEGRENGAHGTYGRELVTTPNGFTWEDLQSLCMQASFLRPVNGKQPAPRSIQRAGKRKICWFRNDAELGIPKARSIFELLRPDYAEKDRDLLDLDSHEIDLTPLRLLLQNTETRNTEQKQSSRSPNRRGRSRSVDTIASRRGYEEDRIPPRLPRAQTFDDTLGPSPFRAIHEEPAVMEPDERMSILNVSSSQKYAFSWKASQNPSSWMALELITLKFPSTREECNFALSRLTVTAWTSLDHRVIIPRSRTVVRIESLSREFCARKEFVNMLPDDRRQAAIAEAEALFKRGP